jgi:hypothetical protein
MSNYDQLMSIYEYLCDKFIDSGADNHYIRDKFCTTNARQKKKAAYFLLLLIRGK